ncbi:TetR/AcrR family transcriptional regulator [Shewanella gelidii]|uniref:TetR family transcriptional regulator n=1 Tax=Shewanella gelidii TaxID=1642821 RepID=A0A917JZD9_9GAMM|nr:TetR/AcrR family transcriptional regulator [Shewanella gelidii]MCL1098955.1 TetR/AcrR family transcriptional regulator [Shewanella gelidii]GGI90232.1 TetR family transcriptional regulator [Shewanella gelidii]
MTATKPACVGRPRGFDIDLALEQALEVFWRNGYEGTSLVDLTEAMGIKKPSLYAAFGNKEQLFIKAIELYENRPDSLFHQAIQLESTADFIRKLLVGGAEQLTDCSHPQGCALIKSTLSCSEASESIKTALNAHKEKHFSYFLGRFEQAKANGELAAGVEPIDISNIMGTFFNGMSIQATEGLSREELKRAAELIADSVIARCLN